MSSKKKQQTEESQLNESYDEVKKLKKTIESLEKTNQQLLIDKSIVEKAEMYDKLKESRKLSIDKYHSTNLGTIARKKASIKYYLENREKILAKKRIRYKQQKDQRAINIANMKNKC